MSKVLSRFLSNLCLAIFIQYLTLDLLNINLITPSKFLQPPIISEFFVFGPLQALPRNLTIYLDVLD